MGFPRGFFLESSLKIPIQTRREKSLKYLLFVGLVLEFMSTPVQRQTGSPYWYADLRKWDAAKGKEVRKLVSTKCTSKREAQKIADEMARAANVVAAAAKNNGLSRSAVMDLVNGLLMQAGIRQSVHMESWRSFVTRWMKARAVKPRSRAVYDGHVADWEMFLGSAIHAPMADITVGHVQDWYDGMTRRLAPDTVLSRMKFIRRVFKRARAERVIETSPFDLLERERRRCIRREPFTREEIVKLVETCRAKGWRERETMLWLGLCTAARLGDCAMMGTHHWDRAAGVLRWTQQKTGMVMEVPVVEPLRSHLMGLVAEGYEGLFCPGMARVTGPTRSMAFRAVLKAAGVGVQPRSGNGGARVMRQRSFHCLRHTLTTWMAEGGVEDSTRMLVTGHATKESHLRYTHETLASRLRALEAKRRAVELGLSILTIEGEPVG